LEVGEASVVAQLEPVRSSPRSYRLRREQHQRHRLERLSGAASKWCALGCKLPNGEGSAWPGNPGLREKLGLLICTTPAYSPESNGMAESFVRTFKTACQLGDDDSCRVVIQAQEMLAKR